MTNILDKAQLTPDEVLKILVNHEERIQSLVADIILLRKRVKDLENGHRDDRGGKATTDTRKGKKHPTHIIRGEVD